MRWAEAVCLLEISNEMVAEAFITTWVSRSGILMWLVTDRGVHFMSALFQSLCQLLGVNHMPTMAYHPATNGLVERLHRSLKQALRAHGSQETWPSLLPRILLILRSSPRREDGMLPFEVTFRAVPVLPG